MRWELKVEDVGHQGSRAPAHTTTHTYSAKRPCVSARLREMPVLCTASFKSASENTSADFNNTPHE